MHHVYLSVQCYMLRHWASVCIMQPGPDLQEFQDAETTIFSSQSGTLCLNSVSGLLLGVLHCGQMLGLVPSMYQTYHDISDF